MLGWAEIARRIAMDDYFDVIEVNPLPDDETRQAVRAIADMGHMRLCQNAHGRLLGTGLALSRQGAGRLAHLLLAG